LFLPNKKAKTPRESPLPADIIKHLNIRHCYLFWLDIANNLGYLTWKAIPYLNLQYQNLVFSQFHTLLSTSSLNQLIPPLPSIFIISFHHLEVVEALNSPPPSTNSPILLPYFSIRTSFQSVFSPFNNLHHHLANKLTWTTIISLTPRPPFSFGWHTDLHLTQLIFWPPLHLPKGIPFEFSPTSSILFRAFSRKICRK